MAQIEGISVYMAGAVVESYLWKNEYFEAPDYIVKKTKLDLDNRICKWREIAFDSKHGEQEPGAIYYRKPVTLIYAGPTIYSTGHHIPAEAPHSCDDDLCTAADTKQYRRDLVQRCLTQVVKCVVVFAWIDRENTVGTVVEITTAILCKKPVFIVFETVELAEHFYFLAHTKRYDFDQGKTVTPESMVGALAEGWHTFVSWVSSNFMPLAR